jgi:hypothetical protein
MDDTWTSYKAAAWSEAWLFFESGRYCAKIAWLKARVNCCALGTFLPRRAGIGVYVLSTCLPGRGRYADETKPQVGC